MSVPSAVRTPEESEMLRRTLFLSVLAVSLSVTSCGPATPEGLVPDAEPIAHCDYRNPFSSNDECQEYWGSSWTLESAAENCETDIAGGAGEFTEGEGCGLTYLPSPYEFLDPFCSPHCGVSGGELAWAALIRRLSLAPKGGPVAEGESSQAKS